MAINKKSLVFTLVRINIYANINKLVLYLRAKKNKVTMKEMDGNISFAEVERVIKEENRSVKIMVNNANMSPYFKAGRDYVIVSPPPTDILGKISRGDIILFNIGDDIHLHRIIHYFGTLLEIRGDGMYGKKNISKITGSDILGIVTEGTYRGGKPFRTDTFSWKFSAWFWVHSYFVRHQFVRVKRLIKKVFCRKSL